MTYIRPILGFTQGLIVYLLFTQAHLSGAGTLFALIALNFPLWGLQIKLPNKKMVALGIGILISMGLIYGYAVYHLINLMHASSSYLPSLLAFQCALSAFILFVFYCVLMEEGRFHFPYLTLFSEFWQIILKVFLGQLLVYLTWALFILAAKLFELLGIFLISNWVFSKPFIYIMPSFFFGIAMTILYRYEDILTKLRNILLAFCRFLYPIFVVISLSFLLVIPFAHKIFADFWPVIVGLSIANILLFNGIFQAGFTQAPYARWFSILIYASLIIITLYSFYILRFPLSDMKNYGFKPEVFLLLLLLLFLFTYHLCYSLAVFFSKKPWLSMIRHANTVIALVIAITYLVLALPLVDIGKISSKAQLSRLLNNKAIINSQNTFSNPGYLVGVNLQKANLEGRDLRNINFSGADLRGANLVNANLENADFSKANLADVNLNSANLQFVKFKEANLVSAQLSSANLSFAQFDKTNLTKANFTGAILKNSWFNQAIFQQTNFSNADLSNAYGLGQSDLNKACGNNVALPEKLSIKPCMN
ncbi:pentapeptide repeat-containing protein [Legionella micdadei]|uniref:pentapeptide repeat-containing protein n=1 Tax=Legionella micdadei TaxID=451 RepID=UPI0015600BE8|nr:pentapeptide repeat-containing protein [Legionella micdadei]